MSILFCVFSFAALVFRAERIPNALRSIINSAFEWRGAIGGIGGFFVSKSVRTGVMRGLISNEAGAGTSAMAHSRARERSPKVAGLFGMCEVFFDTVILCSATALAVLVSVDDLSVFQTPMSLVNYAFSSSLGSWSSSLLLLCIFSFAYSTIICWYYYGAECVRYLFGKIGAPVFTVFFFIFALTASVINSHFLLATTNFLLFFMVVLTLLTLVFNTRTIREITFNNIA